MLRGVRSFLKLPLGAPKVDPCLCLWVAEQPDFLNNLVVFLDKRMTSIDTAQGNIGSNLDADLAQTLLYKPLVVHSSVELADYDEVRESHY